MKKRISCKVIRSIPLGKEDVISSSGDVLKLRKISSYLNFHHVKSRPVIYSNKMQIEKDSVYENQQEQSVDFYA
ncbi:MAG: hypothetical protein JXA96_00225 [Sedimentisphaerales bacterium]|nr:hypothetical protein [Sedimentisphaerales bacterium]